MQKKTALRYLTSLPVEIPQGSVLAHNHVRPARILGCRGFRAWLAPEDDPLLEPCDCGWAPELGPHQRVKRIG